MGILLFIKFNSKKKNDSQIQTAMLPVAIS